MVPTGNKLGTGFKTSSEMNIALNKRRILDKTAKGSYLWHLKDH